MSRNRIALEVWLTVLALSVVVIFMFWAIWGAPPYLM